MEEANTEARRRSESVVHASHANSARRRDRLTASHNTVHWIEAYLAKASSEYLPYITLASSYPGAESSATTSHFCLLIKL